MRIHIISVPNVTGFAHYWLTVYIYFFYRIKTTCKDSLVRFALVEERDGRGLLLFDIRVLEKA